MLETDGSVWISGISPRIGQLWSGSGHATVSKPWFDPDRGTVWVATGDRLLEFSVDPVRWAEPGARSWDETSLPMGGIDMSPQTTANNP